MVGRMDCPYPSSPQKPGAPLVWLMQGSRHGDNEQVLALGAALRDRFGWPACVKRMVYRRAALPRVALAQALDHVDLARSDPITGAAAGPAPDLVISVGRRAAPVARWIKAQHARGDIPAGIHVQIGRYQDHFADVDLLVTTAQYALPAAPNVLHLTLPVTARAPAALAAAAASFAPDWQNLKRPLIGVLVGGPSRPIGFDAADGRRLLAEASTFAASRGGTLLVATSPRTPAAVTEHFRRQLAAPHRLFVFAETRDGPNPYLALLALCDSFIVTTDSVSMMADACLTARETRLFQLPVEPRRPLWHPAAPANWAGRRRVQRLLDDAPADLIDRWFDGRVRRGRAQPTRYVPILVEKLLREGQVAALDAAVPPGTGLAGLAATEREGVLARIEALLASRRVRPDGAGAAQRPPAAGVSLPELTPARV